MVSEEVVDFVASVDGDEEDFAIAFAPDVQQICGVRKMGGASGKVEPKSMEVERPSTRKTCAAEVEGDGGAVGLIAVEENWVSGARWIGWLRDAGWFRRSLARRAWGRSGRRRCARR